MTDSRNSEFQKIADKFLRLTPREQVLIFASGIVLILLLSYTFLLEPTKQRAERLQADIAKVKHNLQDVQRQIDNITVQFQQDPNIAVRKRLDSLNQEILALDEKLHSQTSHLVPAKQMTKVLESVLASSKDLKLIELRSIKPTPFFINVTNKGKNTEKADLYRHGVSIVLEGKYFEIQAYLTALESLQWKFYWQKFDYKVEQYPVSRVELEIYTVSTSKAFIGG